MDFRQKSPIKVAMKRASTTLELNKAKSAAPRRAQTDADTFGGNGRTITHSRVISNPVSRKRSLQQIQAEEDAFDQSAWGDTDNEDGGDDAIVVNVESGNETEMDDKPAKKSRRAVSSAGPGTQRKEVAGGTLARRRTIGTTSSSGMKMSSDQNPTGKGSAARILHVDDDVDAVNRGMSKSPVDACCQALRKVINKVSYLNLSMGGAKLTD